METIKYQDTNINNNDWIDPLVIKLERSDNKITTLVCPNVTYLECSDNKITSLNFPPVTQLNCSDNNLEEINCFMDTRVNRENSRKIIKRLPLPEVITDNYNCNICSEDKTSKIVCSSCNNFHCADCYIRIFETNSGLVKCPSCRVETKFNIDNDDIKDYVNNLKEILL